jgi:hypothetical protein
MAPLGDGAADALELQRLNYLLPMELRSQVSIGRSMAISPPLIATERTKKHRLMIQIDAMRWQQLPTNQQDLLFWHEVARIQAKTVSRSGWEMPVMVIGIGLALIEISAQNVISLAAALVAVALAGHQLYQRHLGERSLREAVMADRGAIQLATAAGYSFMEATTSLYDSLKALTRVAQKADWQRYQVRLRALEIWLTEREKRSQPNFLELAVAWQS